MAGHHLARVLARVEGRDDAEGHDGEGAVTPCQRQPDEGQAWAQS